MNPRHETRSGITVVEVSRAPQVIELYEPMNHQPGSESHRVAVAFGQKMMERGFVGQHVRSTPDGKAVVKFFKP